MDNNLDTYDLFLRFTKGQLSESEVDAFNQRLNNDDSFNQDFQDFELANNIILNKELIEVKHIISEVSNAQKTNNKFKYLAVGLGVLIISSIALLNSNTEKKKVDANNTSIISKSVDSIKKTLPKKPEKQPYIKLTPQNKKEAVSIENDFTIDSTILISEKNTPLKHNTDTIVDVVHVPDSEEKENTTISEPQKISQFECPDLLIKADLKPTCIEGNTGSIEIEEVSNATLPVLYSFEGQEESTETYYSFLEKGSYTISVTDKEGCNGSQVFQIDSEYCVKDHYEISYSYQSYWTIPVKENGRVEVLNRAGNQVIELQIFEDEETIWDGLNSLGERLTPGLYTFIIITNHKKTYTGSISVLE